jgi:DtxR family Mn-dependent transcriptional regulator
MDNCKHNGNGREENRICKDHVGNEQKHLDELLETIWDLREKGKVAESHLKESGPGRVVLEFLPILVKNGLAIMEDGHLKLTQAGEIQAHSIVRRHRLTERMLTDLFDIPESRIEGLSCEFEHILSEEVTDSICSFLGHPAQCPHGKPIPRGECCDKLERVIRPLVMPLSDLMPGEKGKISFLSFKDRSRLQRLSSLGIVPGETVLMQQKMPAVVIKVHETEVALDPCIVREIFVKRVNGK